MGRNLRNTTLPTTKPGEMEAAPHRYLWTGFDDDYRFKWAEIGYQAWKAAVPYKVGEVIYIEYTGGAHRKALIVDVGSYRPEAGPHAGDKVETYRVVYETAKGEWSGNWLRVYPGNVQRGYKRAGLATEIPENA